MFPEWWDYRYYNGVLLSGTIAANLLYVLLLFRERLPVLRLLLLKIPLFLIALLGAKLASIWMLGDMAPWRVELIAGLRYTGALVGTVLGIFALSRFLPAGVSVGRWADVIVPGYLLNHFIGRIGCLINGCCFGSVWHLPWALTYPAKSFPWYHQLQERLISIDATTALPVHPLPGYFALLELALLIGCLWYLRRLAPAGRVALGALAIHSLLKALIEFLRAPYDVRHQVPLVVVGLLALAAIAVLAPRARAKAISIEHAR